MEVLSRRPLVVVDGAHNTYSATRLRKAVEDYLSYQRVILVIGVSSDKDYEGIVSELAPLVSQVIACSSRNPRSRSPQDIAVAFAKLGIPTHHFPSVSEATHTAI